MFSAAAFDPARPANMPDNLRAAAEGFGVSLPIPSRGGGDGLGGLLDAVVGESSKKPAGGGGIVEGLQQLLGGGASEAMVEALADAGRGGKEKGLLVARRGQYAQEPVRQLTTRAALILWTGWNVSRGADLRERLIRLSLIHKPPASSKFGGGR